MNFYYLVSEKRLVRSLTDASSPTSFELMQSDTEDIFVRAVEEVPEDQQDAGLFREIPLSATTIKLWIGGIELPPTGGTWKAKVGANETAALAWNVSRTELETALNALASVTSAGGLTVLEKTGTPQASNYYLIEWTNPAAVAVVEHAENKLTPRSRISTSGGTDPDIKTQAVVLEQYPPLFTDQFVRPVPPALSIARLRIGSGVQNEVQTLTIPRESRAVYALSFSSLVTKPLPANAPARDIAAALNALFTDAKERFTARLSRRGVVEITCTGPLANASQPLIAVQLLDNPSADYAFAALSLKGYRLMLEMRGLKTKTFTLELEINNGADTKTPLQIPCTIRNDAIPDSVALIPPESEDPQWLEPEPSSTPVHDPSQIVVGNRSYSQLIGGTTADVGNPLAFTITHNLDSMQVHVTLTENTGDRKRIEDVVYELRILNADQIRITWKAGPAPAQDSISALITAVPEVETFNPHTHFFSEIKKSLAEPDVTLEDVLTAILAGQNTLDVWPQIPVDKIADGSITADKLDLDSLIAALTGTGGVATERFLAGLRELVKDSTLIENLVTALATSESLRETFKNFIERIFATIKETATLQESFFETLKAIPGFETFLRGEIVSALQGSAGTLPSGTVLFVTPPWEFVFPPPQQIPAPSIRTEAFADVQVTDTTTKSGNTTVTTSKAASANYSEQATVRYDLLSPAIFSPANGGNVSGLLSPTATAGQKYTATAAVNARTATTRRGRDWKSGTILTRQNGHWYETRVATSVAGETLWPVEMEDTAMRYDITADMLRVGSRFSLPWLLQAALEGNAFGKIDLIAELGSSSDGGVGVGHNLMWTPIFTQRIPLTATLALHQFLVEIERRNVTTSVTRDFVGAAGSNEFTLDTRGLANGMTVTGTDFPPGTTLEIFDLDTENGTVFTSQEKLSSGTNTCVCSIATPQQFGTYERYGAATTFEVPSAAFALRVRVANFDCEDTWLSGVEARGCMELKIVNTSASIAPL